MPSSVRRYRYHRFYFAIVFKRNASARGSVLLGSNSTSELDRLAAQLLTEPDSVCSNQSTHCAVFPEDCPVAVEMNGQPVRLGPIRVNACPSINLPLSRRPSARKSLRPASDECKSPL